MRDHTSVLELVSRKRNMTYTCSSYNKPEPEPESVDSIPYNTSKKDTYIFDELSQFGNLKIVQRIYKATIQFAGAQRTLNNGCPGAPLKSRKLPLWPGLSDSKIVWVPLNSGYSKSRNVENGWR